MRVCVGFKEAMQSRNGDGGRDRGGGNVRDGEGSVRVDGRDSARIQLSPTLPEGLDVVMEVERRPIRSHRLCHLRL